MDSEAGKVDGCRLLNLLLEVVYEIVRGRFNQKTVRKSLWNLWSTRTTAVNEGSMMVQGKQYTGDHLYMRLTRDIHG